MIKLTAKELHQRLREEANKHAPHMGGGDLNMLTNCDTTTSKTYLHTIPCKCGEKIAFRTPMAVGNDAWSIQTFQQEMMSAIGDHVGICNAEFILQLANE